MPELPELEVVCEVLQRRLLGQSITAVRVFPPGGPIVVRDLIQIGLERALLNAAFARVTRRGKFLVFAFQPPADFFLALNPKLTGRLQLAAPGDRRQAKTHLCLTLANSQELRYLDQKTMGQIYLTRNLAEIPEYAGLGPEPSEVSLEEFRARLKPYRGEIKGVLTRGEFIAGIGNAYADEILWTARLHPYRKRTQLTAEEIERLYAAVRATLSEATEKVRAEMGEAIHQERRDFMAIHMKTGEPCPRCGTSISRVSANQRITNFCRACQPGGLIKGMDA